MRLSLGVTGHRETNAAFAANRARIAATLAAIFAAIDTVVASEPQLLGPGSVAPTRLHSLLVDGLDQMAATQALERGWDLVAPLPFGRVLNTAINAHPQSAAEMRFLLTGEGSCSDTTRAHAAAINRLEDRALRFELADADAAIAELFLAKTAAPHDVRQAQAYAAHASERVALATQVLIEQSDFIVAVWDAATTSYIGGTGHTIALALDKGAPVVWIDARAPEKWRILYAPESLAGIMAGVTVHADRNEALAKLVRDALQPLPGKKHHGAAPPTNLLHSLDTERWRPRSNPFWHAYRRVEALFGADDMKGRFRNLTQTYESPDAISAGSAASQMAAARALDGQDPEYATRIETDVLRRFAWADGISARLSDVYRGGMTLNFMLSALAIVGGIVYLPFGADKRPFAVFELTLLTAIVVIILIGQRRRWHERWFETRRVAEYLRHAPILQLLGVSRPAGRWPRGSETSWPEWYARHALRDVGLPRIAISPAYLRGALENLLRDHVVRQREYHRAKARRLSQAHHRLDRLSQVMFVLALTAVASYLVLIFVSPVFAARSSKVFTVLGVMLPTLAGAIAGVRFFGDFERFSAISEVTAEKLDAVAGRIDLLLSAPASAIDYARVSELAHAADEIVVSEIENWQSVFGGKHIAVPV